MSVSFITLLPNTRHGGVVFTDECLEEWEPLMRKNMGQIPGEESKFNLFFVIEVMKLLPSGHEGFA